MNDLFEDRKAKIVELISRKPMTYKDIAKTLCIAVSTTCEIMKDIRKEYEVISANSNPKSVREKYYSIGIHQESQKQRKTREIINLIKNKHMTYNELSKTTGIWITEVREIMEYIKGIYDVDMVRANISRKEYAYGIGIKAKNKYSDLPKQISDVFLINWCMGKPEFINKSTKSIIEMLKKEYGVQVYRLKDDGGRKYL